MHNVGELGLSQILAGVQFPGRLHCHVLLITENVQTENIYFFCKIRVDPNLSYFHVCYKSSKVRNLYFLSL